MMVVGLTGGIGSGKTSVAIIFEILDVPVYYSDVRAKYLMENDESIIRFIKENFEKEVYNSEDKLNRSLLSNIIFNNPAKLSKLNAVVHPAVARDFELWKKDQIHPFIIKESALLIETMQNQKPDYIVVVSSPKELRIKRIQIRDHLSEPEIIRRMNSQLEDEERLKYADCIIRNDNQNSLVVQTLDLYRFLMKNVNNQKIDQI